MAKRVKVASAYVSIDSDSRGLDKDLAKLSRKMRHIGWEMQRLGIKLLAAGAAIQAPLTLAVQQFSKIGDAAAKAAKRTGLLSAEFSELAHVAELSGTGPDSLENALLGMQKSLYQLTHGSTQAQASFAQLGLSAKDLVGMNVSQQFELLADRISGFRDESQRTAMAMRVFGRAGAQILPMLDLGAAGIRHYRQEAVRLGVSIGPDLAAKAEKLNDMMGRLKTSVKGVAITVGSILAEGATKTLTYLTNLIANIREYLQNNPQVVTALQRIAIGLTAVGAALIGLGTATKVLSYLVSPGGVLLGLAGLVVYLTGALDPLIAKWGQAVMGFEVGGQTIRQWLSLVGETFGELWDGIKGAMHSLESMLAPAWQAIKGFFDMIWQHLKLGFLAAKSWMIDQILGLVTRLRKVLLDTLRDSGSSWVAREAAGKALPLTNRLYGALQSGRAGAASDLASQRQTAAGSRKTAGGGLSAAWSAIGTAFSGAGARLKEAFSGIGSKWSPAIGKFMETILGQKGSAGGVRGLADIFKGLGRQFPEWQGRAPGYLNAGPSLQAAMSTTGTFSGLGARQMGQNEAPLIKLGKEQLAVLKQIRDRVGGSTFEPTDW